MIIADDALAEHLIADPALLDTLAEPLPDDVAAAVVERFKQEADRHWYINANRSLEFADRIVQIGSLRHDTRQLALGLMARGDALKHLGHLRETWSILEQAGELFLSVADEVGWARTRIGRLAVCVDLNRVPEALADAERARTIFVRNDNYDKALRVDLNAAIVHKQLGDYQQALLLYQTALASAQSLNEPGDQHLGLLFTCIGNVYDILGDFRQASAYHERAYTQFTTRNETNGIATAELNLAHIAISQGQYRHALDLLHRALASMVAENILLDAAHVKRRMVECYLLLNRFIEARDLAQHVSAEFQHFDAAYETALTLLYLALAEAELNNFDAARAVLDRAEPIFVTLDAATWVATTRLRRGQIALRQGDTETAMREATAAATCFEQHGQQVDYATARLVQGQAALLHSELQTAAEAGAVALQIAQQCNVPTLRYAAYVLLGRVAEAQNDVVHAARRYRAAAATVDRVQRSLTITLRPGFLEDKTEALRALIDLHLRNDDAWPALETLERAKSQVLLGYLTNQEQLRWAAHDPKSQALIEELNQLRAEHQWFYRLAHEQPAVDDEQRRRVAPEQALCEIARCEHQMRAITEQLYIQNGGNDAHRITPSIRDVQRRLDPETLLIEFYSDGERYWAFALDARSLTVHRLPIAVEQFNHLLAQLQVNLDAALRAGPHGPTLRHLHAIVLRVLQRLYRGLIAPFADRLQQRRRLIFVPYGTLHYLPIHLLHDTSSYLLETHEIVVLPAAGLITRGGPSQPRGALALAHSWDGRLQQTRTEAQMVQQLFGGAIFVDDDAQRAVLQAPPRQILHIAAHGEYRLDQPDLSYILLNDGQLYTDDLLQHNLSYELVTLSACETGRARAAGGDELIGLGRGFLYAGAGAVIGSLWRVPDDFVLPLMSSLYGALHSGASKAAALRHAQKALLATDTALHPAFWGAFQLVGDFSPLSAFNRTSQGVQL